MMTVVIRVMRDRGKFYIQRKGDKAEKVERSDILKEVEDALREMDDVQIPPNPSSIMEM
jgi:hypothetical protein